MATPRKTTASGTAKKTSPRKEAAPRKKAARPGSNGRVPMRQVVLRAAGELQELIGRDPESVVGVERLDGDEWKIQVEVVESQRIPDTTSILAVYEVLADSNGSLVSYRRADRYVRGKFDERAGS